MDSLQNCRDNRALLLILSIVLMCFYLSTSELSLLSDLDIRITSSLFFSAFWKTFFQLFSICVVLFPQEGKAALHSSQCSILRDLELVLPVEDFLELCVGSCIALGGAV